MARKIHKYDYTDAELELAAKVGHSVMQSIDYSFNIPTLPQWNLMSDGYKESMKKNALNILVQDESAKSVHNRWMRELISKGWVLGTEKSNEKKTHPLLIPFDELPIEYKLRLRQFRAAVIPFRKKSDIIKDNNIVYSTK